MSAQRTNATAMRADSFVMTPVRFAPFSRRKRRDTFHRVPQQDKKSITTVTKPKLAKGLAQSVTRRQRLKQFGVGISGMKQTMKGLLNNSTEDKIVRADRILLWLAGAQDQIADNL